MSRLTPRRNGAERLMSDASIRRAIITALALACTVPCDARGQSSAEEHVRDRWAFHAGIIAYGTGDDKNCASGTGLGGGAELRTRGAWLGAVGLDVMLAAPLACTSVLQIAQFRGESVDVSGSTHLVGSPRLRVRGGRALNLGGLLLEATAGAGALLSRTDFLGEDSWLINGWFGGALALRRLLPFGIEAEYGRHQVPIRYYRQDDRSDFVHQFRRWKPFFRISLVL